MLDIGTPCQITNIPISFVEINHLSDTSVASSMTPDTAVTNTSLGNLERNTVSTGDSSALSFATPGKTKLLWNGTDAFSVESVYLRNIVEIPTKDTVRSLSNVVKKIVFPRMKFIPNWDDCLVLTHDKDEDTNEKKAGWTHSVFSKMTWGTDDYFLPYMQAIKWNTYKHAFKQHYNKVRATVISNLKQHLISGKFDLIYFILY